MLYHHQCVTRIAQALHSHDDAVHIARMQANTRLIEHKQSIDQGSAQSGRQIDALHFTSAQSAALSVQCQIANAHVAQVFQARANFIQQ